MARKQGRLGRLYTNVESAFGTAPAIAAANALRHLEFTAEEDPLNRVASRERRRDPSLVSRFDRRESAGWNLSDAYLYPSGTILTKPEMAPILKAGLGAETVPTGAATTLSGTPTVTGGTLTASTGFAIGQMVLITTPTYGKLVRKVTNLVTTTITWSPALPEAPATSAAIKGGISWTPASDLPSSLFFGKYLNDSFSEFVYGAVVETLKITMDANEEIHLSASGPAQKVRTSGGPAEPGGFTTIGGNPPSGILGTLSVGATALDFLKAEVEIKNAMRLIGANSYGQALPTGFERIGKRSLSLSIDAEMDVLATLFTPTETGVNKEIVIQTGNVEGSIWAIHFPAVDFTRPNVPDGDEALVLSYKGVPLGVLGNDEITVAAL